jgi:hypothetical protein
MAVGQLLDYLRWIVPTPQLAILVPECPREDLIALIKSCNVTLLHPNEGQFSNARGDET